MKYIWPAGEWVAMGEGELLGQFKVVLEVPLDYWGWYIFTLCFEHDRSINERT